jgi:predicted dinucleotide-utilizing enzyme
VKPEGKLATKVTFHMGDDIAVMVEVASGAVSGGDGHSSPRVWGIARVEVSSKTPVRPDFFEAFLTAVGQMILTGGIPDLIALHDAQAEAESGLSD